MAANVYRKIKKEGEMMGIRDLKFSKFFIGSICIAYRLPLVTLDRDSEVLRKFGLKLVLVWIGRDRRLHLYKHIQKLSVPFFEDVWSYEVNFNSQHFSNPLLNSINNIAIPNTICFS